MQVFEEKGKLKYPGGKPLRAEKRRNKQTKWKKGGLLPRGITNETFSLQVLFKSSFVNLNKGGFVHYG